LDVPSKSIASWVPGYSNQHISSALPGNFIEMGSPFTLEHPLPVEYKGIKRDCGYRMDILAENRLIIERKAVEEIKGIHKAQLLTYMKLSGFDTGLLINFNVERLKDGIQRFKI
jgi:GxxExxY protein